VRPTRLKSASEPIPAAVIADREDLLTRSRGLGTFVSMRRARERFEPGMDFLRQWAANGTPMQPRVLAFERRGADETFAAALEVAVGTPVLAIKRMRSAAGVPVAIDYRYLAMLRRRNATMLALMFPSGSWRPTTGEKSDSGQIKAHPGVAIQQTPQMILRKWIVGPFADQRRKGGDRSRVLGLQLFERPGIGLRVR
jgi:hypothetical protein